MNAKRLLTIIFGVIALAINVLIIVESCIGGDGSGSQSLGFTNFVVSILERIAPGASFLEDKEHLHSVVRKLFGHFLLFGLAGIFNTLTILFIFMDNENKKDIFKALVSFGIGFTLALVSELIQIFVPGRAGVFTDVLIDFSGFLLFSLITFGFYLLIYYNIKSKYIQEGA